MTKSPSRYVSRRKPRSTARQTHHVLPLHHRIYMVLRQRLLQGEYPPEQLLPGEHQLAQDFTASRVTIRRVLDQLQQDGLIDRRHGAGTFAVGPATAIRGGTGPAMSYYDYIADSSHAYDDELLEFTDIATPGFVLQLDAQFGPRAIKIVRRACLNGIAYHLLSAYLPGDLSAAVSPRAIGNKTVLELLKKQGIVPASSELRIGAIAADTFEAQHLKVDVGAPLVRAIRISRLSDARTIEYNQILSAADIFGYRFTFDGRTGTMQFPPAKSR